MEFEFNLLTLHVQSSSLFSRPILSSKEPISREIWLLQTILVLLFNQFKEVISNLVCLQVHLVISVLRNHFLIPIVRSPPTKLGIILEIRQLCHIVDLIFTTPLINRNNCFLVILWMDANPELFQLDYNVVVWI